MLGGFNGISGKQNPPGHWLSPWFFIQDTKLIKSHGSYQQVGEGCGLGGEEVYHEIGFEFLVKTDGWQRKFGIVIQVSLPILHVLRIVIVKDS